MNNSRLAKIGSSLLAGSAFLSAWILCVRSTCAEDVPRIEIAYNEDPGPIVSATISATTGDVYLASKTRVIRWRAGEFEVIQDLRHVTTSPLVLGLGVPLLACADDDSPIIVENLDLGADGDFVSVIEPECAAIDMSISQDGSDLAILGSDKRIRVWSIRERKKIYQSEELKDDTTRVWVNSKFGLLTSSRDGRSLELSTPDNGFGVDLPVGSHLAAVSGDHTTIAIWNSDSTIKVLAPPWSTEAAVLSPGMCTQGSRVTMNYDGSALAIADGGGSIELWSWEKDSLPVVNRIEGPNRPMTCAMLDTTTATYAGGDDRDTLWVVRWGPQGTSGIWRLPHNSDCDVLRGRLDGGLILLGDSRDREGVSPILWNASSQDPVQNLTGGLPGPVSAIEINNDGNGWAIAARSGWVALMTGPSSKYVSRVKILDPCYSPSIRFSSDGKDLFTLGLSHDLHRTTLATLTSVHSQRLSVEYPTNWASPDAYTNWCIAGKSIVSSVGKVLYALDPMTGNEIQLAQAGDAITSVASSLDGNVIFCADSKGALAAYNATLAKLSVFAHVDTTRPISIRCRRDGLGVVAGDGWRLYVYEASAGEYAEVARYESPHADFDLAFKERFLVGLAGTTVRLWSWKRRKEVADVTFFSDNSWIVKEADGKFLFPSCAGSSAIIVKHPESSDASDRFLLPMAAGEVARKLTTLKFLNED